jgi:hypothetical protein
MIIRRYARRSACSSCKTRREKARSTSATADEVHAREERLQRQVRELQIVIDEERQANKVAEIMESD